MEIRILNHKDELHTCEPFTVGCLLWGTKQLSPTYGRIGFVADEGFYLTMTCEESNPRRTFTGSNTPVYKDSAMEAFFRFAPGGYPSNIYLNFEMNANGTLLAMYGASRNCRTVFPQDWITACRCSAEIAEDKWSVSLLIPLFILKEIYGDFSLEAGSVFSLNFYKLSEASDIEHYASYSPIDSPVPDFHLTEYFEQAMLAGASK